MLGMQLILIDVCPSPLFYILCTHPSVCVYTDTTDAHRTGRGLGTTKRGESYNI